VGTLQDVLIPADEPYPSVRALVVWSKRHLHAVPWADVRSVTPRGTALRCAFDPDAYPKPGTDLIWLSWDVLDKQIVDTAGVKLVRVNDLALVPINDELRLGGVDSSTAGLLRRLGLEWLTRFFGRSRPRLIDWEQVDIGPALNEVRLSVPFDRLRRMHPVDIAAVVSQLPARTGADVLEALHEETAARTLADLPEDHQAAVLAAMEPKEAADVLDEMPPDEAADVLGDLEQEQAEELLNLMEPEAADRVRSLLVYEERTAGGLMNSRVITAHGEDTVDDLITHLRHLAPPEDEVYCLYVVDEAGRLRGVLSPRNLLLAPHGAQVSDAMRGDPEFVKLDESQDEVARKLVRYDLLAIPVLDDDGILKGAVTIDDVVDLFAPESWQSRARRMLG